MARKYTEVKVAGHYHTVEATMKDGKEEIKFSFEKIKNAESLKAVLPTLTAEQVAEVYDNYVYGADLKARAANRPASVVETTIIRIKGKEIDLMSFPPEKLIPAINAKVAALAAEKALNPDAKVPAAFATARKLLVEKGLAKESNGNLVLAKK